MTEGERREMEWLKHEVATAAALTDADRIRILKSLLDMADAIERGKTESERRRHEEIRSSWDEAGRSRYRALAEHPA